MREQVGLEVKNSQQDLIGDAVCVWDLGLIQAAVQAGGPALLEEQDSRAHAVCGDEPNNLEPVPLNLKHKLTPPER